MPLTDPFREYINETFTDLDHGDETISGVEFTGCTFTRCKFTGTTFTECRFHECQFEDCDLHTVEVGGSAFRDVVFEDSRVMAVNWTDAAWGEAGFLNSVAFVDCVLNYSTFIGLKLHNLRMTGCMAKDVDFAEADLTGADFRDTDFTDSRFLHTDLTRADFTDAHNYMINASINTLTDAKFALPEARALLYSLDIELVDPREESAS